MRVKFESNQNTFKETIINPKNNSKSFNSNNIGDNVNNNESSSTINNNTSIFESECNMKIKTCKDIIFNISGEKLPYDNTVILSSCPSINRQLTQLGPQSGEVIIKLPKWVKKNDLLEYFIYYKNGFLLNNDNSCYKNMLKIAEFFENWDLLEKIIQNSILPSLSPESAMLYLVDSYEKIDFLRSNLNLNPNKYLWYEFFIACKDFISSNLIYYIKKTVEKSSLRDKMIHLKSNLLNDILTQYLKEYHQDNEEQIIDEIIYNFLVECRKVGNIYDLITNEYFLIQSKEKLNEGIEIISSLDNNNYPLFEYYFNTIDYNKSSFIELPPLKFNDTIDMIFYLSYNSSKDHLTLSTKARKCIKVKTTPVVKSFKFYYFCNNNENGVKTIMKPLLLNDKSFCNLLSIFPFSKMKMKKISIYIKDNLIHSFMLNFFIIQFNYIYDHPQSNKLPFDFLKIIISLHSYLDASKTFQMLLNWLNDDLNISNEENFSEIIKEIEWRCINKKLLYYFIFKYANLIDKLKLDKYFLIQLKDISIDSEIFSSARDINYFNLYNENKKLRDVLSKRKSDTNANSLNEISSISPAVTNNNKEEENEDKIILKNILEQERTCQYEISSKGKSRKSFNYKTIPSERSGNKETNTTDTLVSYRINAYKRGKRNLNGYISNLNNYPSTTTSRNNNKIMTSFQKSKNTSRKVNLSKVSSRQRSPKQKRILGNVIEQNDKAKKITTNIPRFSIISKSENGKQTKTIIINNPMGNAKGNKSIKKKV